MKKTLLLFVLPLILISCGKKESKQEEVSFQTFALSWKDSGVCKSALAANAYTAVSRDSYGWAEATDGGQQDVTPEERFIEDFNDYYFTISGAVVTEHDPITNRVPEQITFEDISNYATMPTSEITFYLNPMRVVIDLFGSESTTVPDDPYPKVRTDRITLDLLVNEEMWITKMVVSMESTIYHGSKISWNFYREINTYSYLYY